MCRPDMDDLPHTTWTCRRCGFENSMWDAECQNTDCDSVEQNRADYKRDHERDIRKHER